MLKNPLHRQDKGREAFLAKYRKPLSFFSSLLALQSACQQAITAEMQELAAGAGLIGGSKG